MVTAEAPTIAPRKPQGAQSLGASAVSSHKKQGKTGPASKKPTSGTLAPPRPRNPDLFYPQQDGPKVCEFHTYEEPYDAESRETIIAYPDSVKGQAEVETTDMKLQRRLEALGFKPIIIGVYPNCEYRMYLCSKTLFPLPRGKRRMSEERRRKAAEQLARARLAAQREAAPGQPASGQQLALETP